MDGVGFVGKINGVNRPNDDAAQRVEGEAEAAHDGRPK